MYSARKMNALSAMIAALAAMTTLFFLMWFNLYMQEQSASKKLAAMSVDLRTMTGKYYDLQEKEQDDLQDAQSAAQVAKWELEQCQQGLGLKPKQ